MPARKIRVEVADEQGNHYTMTFEGNVTREKALSLLDMVELLGGMQDQQGRDPGFTSASKFDRMMVLLRTCFPVKWFSSKEVLLAYEHELKEPVSLSTVSTYLARMAGRGLLMKADTGPSKRYRLCDARLVGQVEPGKTYR